MTQNSLSNPSGVEDEEESNDHFGALVQAAVDRLPIAQAEAILLVDLHGADYATAARVAGVSVGRFTKNLHAARRSVLATLADQ